MLYSLHRYVAATLLTCIKKNAGIILCLKLKKMAILVAICAILNVTVVLDLEFAFVNVPKVLRHCGFKHSFCFVTVICATVNVPMVFIFFVWILVLRRCRMLCKQLLVRRAHRMRNRLCQVLEL